MFNDLLKQIVARQDLTSTQAEEAIGTILAGECTDAQIGAFMAAMATKGETFEELAGAAQAMRAAARRIQVLRSPVIDTCGTGGDGLDTFNISTATAFVAAGAGITVAKHGNRSVSSKCGSADVLEALGVNLAVDPEITEEAVNTIGIGFMFAPKYHGAMKHAAGPRKELSLRSIFNMLGPLTNPAGATCQLLGVFAPQLTEMFAGALKTLGAQRAMVVHGHDGLDEISICAPTRISELNDGMIRTFDISPEQFFEDAATMDQLVGGDAEMNASILRDIFSGKPGAPRNVVALNAAAAMVVAGKADNLNDGLKLSEETLDSGAALEKLQQLAEFTQANA
jgi:anthranilate phosphoribosyltransferase